MQKLIGLVSIIFVSSMFTAQATAATYDYRASFELFETAGATEIPSVQVSGTFTWDDTGPGGLTIFSFTAADGNGFELWHSDTLDGSIDDTDELSAVILTSSQFYLFDPHSTAQDYLSLSVNTEFDINTNVGEIFSVKLAGVGSSTPSWYGSTAPEGDGYIELTGCSQCTVSPVPIPAALPLFASAILGLGFFNRKRKNKLAVAV